MVSCYLNTTAKSIFGSYVYFLNTFKTMPHFVYKRDLPLEVFNFHTVASTCCQGIQWEKKIGVAARHMLKH